MAIEDDAAILERLTAQIAARLKPVCDQWPQDMFDAMVANLARLTLKFDVHGGQGGVYDRRTTERMIDELKATLDRSEATRHGTPSGSERVPRNQPGDK